MAIRDEDLRKKRITFYEKDIEKINEVCNSLLEKSEALACMLVDTEGHMITQSGKTKLDMESMSALVAGSYAATRQIAKLLGEEEFAMTLHQGKSESIHMNLVGERALLVVVFDEKSTVGKIRLYGDQAATKLMEIFKVLAERKDDGGEGLSQDFSKEANSQLDNLFGG